MNILFSAEAYIGLSILAVFFILNEVVPMVSHRVLPLIAVAAGVIVFLFYRGFL